MNRYTITFLEVILCLCIIVYSIAFVYHISNQFSEIQKVESVIKNND